MEDEILYIGFSNQVVISDQVQVVNTQVPVISPTQVQVFQDEDVGARKFDDLDLRCNESLQLEEDSTVFNIGGDGVFGNFDVEGD
ncbi:hypothetical protein L1987_08920 [Smallanthus sonchifolius]|uniref:Uncharacterized protein n=1 Tax=Smallanthus sonchifolius TaxID=185202 RepID=A0ACB9JLZ9_9ASTR|nr:hypothetical protein L1987_08920 [Smallanthus sonchifolius]